MRLITLGSMPFRIVAVALAATVGLATPLQAEIAGKVKGQARLKTVDVSLTKTGLLYGQVVTKQGKPMASTKVALYGRDGKPIIATTNKQGAFGYQGLKGGVYYLQSGESVRVCRVWSPKAAPPKAGQAVLIVADTKAVLGQYEAPPHVNNFVRGSKRLMTNPLAVAGIVATAVAIPVAIANDDDPSS